ncbi:MAG: lactonase family protein [Planctomycetales bacterium]|nr:lactonase family protein [Planctomycetales bacterium]
MSKTVDVWIGTTTPRNGESKGIYHSTLDTETGALGPVTLAAELGSPGFVALHPKAPRLYAVGSHDGQSVVASFAIESSGRTKSLRLLKTTAIPDGGAAHLALDREGKVLMTAQYGAGSTALFSINDDGIVDRHLQSVKHQGGSRVVPKRQDSPHAHWAGVSPDNRFAFVPDLGLDQVVIYRLESGATPRLHPHGAGNTPPGGGPRHMKFHPNGKTIYVLNELALSVTVFDYDAEAGTMTAVQSLPTVPEVEKAKENFVSASEIRVHPTGKFVYAANRGHDTITAFRVNESDGKLTLIEREPIRGSWPRNFNLDPTGRWLVAAGRDSNTLAVFEVNSDTGELTYTLKMASAPTPICVEFGK